MEGSGRHWRFLQAIMLVVWVVGVAVGLLKMTSYSLAATGGSYSVPQWPKQESRIRLSADRPTLLVTLHPRCPCSRATLEELSKLIVEASHPPQVSILAYMPDGADADWSESDLLTTARSIPGVAITFDHEGLESRRFGLTVSGETALYSTSGRLLFSGGITAARGHVGDNAGRSAILAILANRPPATTRTPAFGCSILDSRSPDARGQE